MFLNPFNRNVAQVHLSKKLKLSCVNLREIGERTQTISLRIRWVGDGHDGIQSFLSVHFQTQKHAHSQDTLTDQDLMIMFKTRSLIRILGGFTLRLAWVAYQLQLSVLELMHGAYSLFVNKVFAKNFANPLFTVVYSNFTSNLLVASMQLLDLGPDFHAGQLSPMGAKMEYEKTVS